MKRWYHVVSYTSCWGFSINENNIVVDVAPVAQKELQGKSVKDPTVRKWFIENNLTVTEVKTYSEDEQQVHMADVL